MQSCTVGAVEKDKVIFTLMDGDGSQPVVKHASWQCPLYAISTVRGPGITPRQLLRFSRARASMSVSYEMCAAVA